MNQKILIKTFGCQMNEYDSNRIFDTVKEIGYEKTNWLWSKLFKTTDLVTELAPQYDLGTELNFSSSEARFNTN